MRGARRRPHSRRPSALSGRALDLSLVVKNSEPGLQRLTRRDLPFLLLFLLGGLVLVTLPYPHQLGLATAVRSTALRPILELHGAIDDLSSTRAGLQAVQAERDSLAAQVLALQGVEEENLRLRELVELSERGGSRFQPANLYPAGRTGEAVKRSFMLDVGTETGVTADAPVVAPQGLVGVVRAPGRGQATGDFWTHPEFRVSAMSADGRVFGIIRPLPGLPPAMQLYGTPYQASLQTGAEIVTSGVGGVFPRGIPIGQVHSLMGTEAGWARTYRVTPLVYPESVREVMVIVRAETGEVAEAWDVGSSEGTEGRGR